MSLDCYWAGCNIPLKEATCLGVVFCERRDCLSSGMYWGSIAGIAMNWLSTAGRCEALLASLSALRLPIMIMSDPIRWPLQWMTPVLLGKWAALRSCNIKEALEMGEPFVVRSPHSCPLEA